MEQKKLIIIIDGLKPEYRETLFLRIIKIMKPDNILKCSDLIKILDGLIGMIPYVGSRFLLNPTGRRKTYSCKKISKKWLILELIPLYIVTDQSD